MMTQTSTGWILDVYIENDEAVLWIKTDEGQALRVIDNYEPVFYILPKTEQHGTEILQILQDLELVTEVKWDFKLIDINSTIKEKLIYIRCYSIHHYNLLLKALQHEIFQQRTRYLFNTKLSHIQRYLFTQLRVPSGSKVKVKLEDGKLISICKLSDNKEFQSPFSLMYVKLVPSTEQEVLDRDDPIQSIRVRYDSDDLMLEDSESKMLQDFSNYVISKDPDIIVFENHNPDILYYLLDRVRLLSLDLQLGTMTDLV